MVWVGNVLSEKSVWDGINDRNVTILLYADDIVIPLLYRSQFQYWQVKCDAF